MATDERKDREQTATPEFSQDEKIQDLVSKNVDSEEQDKVKGGLLSHRPVYDEQ